VRSITEEWGTYQPGDGDADKDGNLTLAAILSLSAIDRLSALGQEKETCNS
jgi:hypothetical protein